MISGVTVCKGQVTSLSQGLRVETNNHSCTGDLEQQTNLMSKFLVLEKAGITQENMRTQHRKAPVQATTSPHDLKKNRTT